MCIWVQRYDLACDGQNLNASNQYSTRASMRIFCQRIIFENKLIWLGSGKVSSFTYLHFSSKILLLPTRYSLLGFRSCFVWALRTFLYVFSIVYYTYVFFCCCFIIIWVVALSFDFSVVSWRMYVRKRL